MAYKKQTWVDGVTPLDAEHLNHMEQGISQLSEEIANLNTDGISATARNLLITILRNGVYSSDQKANITDLETALGGSDAPVVKSYAITNTLTNCTTNNAVTSVTDGDSYTATLTAADGYALNSVVVTMGGTDITSTAYSGSVITIASVTGDVSIVATAVATESGGSETVVNLFDKNTMVITGYFWGTNGAPYSDAGSKYVKVPAEAGKTYAIQKSGTYDNSQWNAGSNGVVSWVSADGTALSAAINTNALNAHIDPNSKGVVTNVAPDGVAYICFSAKVFENGIDYTDTTMVEEGDTCHDYVAYA